MPDFFEYNPAAIPDLIHAVATTRGHLEDVRSQALNALTTVREELQGRGRHFVRRFPDARQQRYRRL